MKSISEANEITDETERKTRHYISYVNERWLPISNAYLRKKVNKQKKVRVVNE